MRIIVRGVELIAQEHIDRCTRCGRDHGIVEFKALSRPIETSSATLNYWAPCPTNGEPMLMAVTGPGAL